MAVTINDIAAKSGVSSATVSRVLNNSGYVKVETKEKILHVIKELNYVPSEIARGLSKNETDTIGVIVPDITNQYFGEMIKGISEVAEENGLNVIFFNTDNDINKELKALKEVKKYRIKGVIATPGFGQGHKAVIKPLEDMNVPIILVAADLRPMNFSGVFVDDVFGAFNATKLLINEGHRKIGIITGILKSNPASDRLIGYKQALRENNIEISEKYIFQGDFQLEKSYGIAKKIINMEDPPTALLTCSNMISLGAIKALLESNKKIPDDMAIVGINRVEFLDIMGVKLTYVEDFPQEMGRNAVRVLIEIASSNKVDSPIRIKTLPKLILNGSEKKYRVL